VLKYLHFVVDIGCMSHFQSCGTTTSMMLSALTS